MLRDLVLTFRLARRAPLLVLVVVLTLGLGIGATLAVLGVLDAIVRRPLPYPDAEELVLVLGAAPEHGQPYEAISYPTYLDWRRENHVFRDLAAASMARPFVLTGVDTPTTIHAEIVSSNYFALLGISPALGRTFSEDEESAPGPEPPVIVSTAFWQTRLGGGELGEELLRINDLSFRVVGVMPPSFRGLLWQAVDVWLPVGVAESLLGPTYRAREIRWLSTVARLDEGVSPEQAREGMVQVAKALEEEYPAHYHKRTVGLHPLDQFFFGPELRQALRLLLVAALFVLVLCATNVGALLTVDALGRRREIAIRSSLGAGVLRLVRQFTVQSLVLSALGSAIALLLASRITPHLVALTEIRPATFEESYLGRPVLLASAALILLLGFSFGALPTLVLSRLGLVEALKQGARSGSGSPWARFMRGALVTLQVAVGFVLFASATLLLQSLRDLTGSSPGFAIEDLITIQIDLPAARYDDGAARRFAERLSERVESLADVRAVTATGPNLAPLAVRTIQGATPEALSADGQGTGVATLHRHSVLPGYFSTVGIPLLEGRGFTSSDDAQHPAVVVVSRSVADLLWPEGTAVGSLLHLEPAGPTPETPPHTVVGVVADVRHRGFIYAQDVDLDVYFSLPQDPLRSFFLLVRTAADARLLQGPIRRIGRDLDPEVPLDRIQTMQQRFALDASNVRLHAVISSLFAALALLLAAVGLYGILALGLREQRREIAVRLALGATPGAVARHVLAGGARLLLPGLLLGALGCLAARPLLSAALHGLSPTDPFSLLLSVTVLTAVGIAASLIPAWRAARVEPARLLTSE